MYGAYEFYLQAKLYEQAHNLAVTELAPDAIIRSDLTLLRELFMVFVDKQVQSWYDRGKVRFLFLSYSTCRELTAFFSCRCSLIM